MWAIFLFCLMMAWVNYRAKFYFGGIGWDFRFNERGTMPCGEQKVMVFLFIWAFILIKTKAKEYQIEIFQALETIMESCPRHNASLGITQIYCFYFPLGGIQSHHQTFISSGFHTLGLDLHNRAAKIVLTMPSVVDTLILNFPRNIIPQAYVLRMAIHSEI